MTTRALDLESLLAEPDDGGAWRMPGGTRVGHVHLKTNDIALTERFYVDVLGFDLTARYGHRASFVAAGGYHHHVAFNTWESAGAPPPPEGAAGLRWFEVLLPHRDALDAVLARLREGAVAVAAAADGVQVRDPAGNDLRLVVRGG
jgi:catechol 2,3-dioxygenase